MNAMTDDLNSKIKAVCETNPRCVFVDANSQVDRLKGHFCEEGVDESESFFTEPSEGANRYAFIAKNLNR